MDAVYIAVGSILGSGLFAAGLYLGWRVGFLSRGDTAPRIIEQHFDGGDTISLEPAYWPDKQAEN